MNKQTPQGDSPKDKGIEKLARWLHEEYEDKARLYNWKTQEKCRVDFDDLPLENKKVMLAMALEIDRRIQQERKEIVEKFKNDLPMEGEKHKLTPFQETVNTYIKNRIEEIEEHLNNK